MPHNAPAAAAQELLSRGGTPPPIINSTPVPLQRFVVRVTGEPSRPVIHPSIDSIEAELRRTKDRFHGETMYERDWRDGRVDSRWQEDGDESLTDDNAKTPAASAVYATSPLDAARSPITAGGRSSAPGSPVSTSSSSYAGASRGPKSQLSSLRNEFRVSNPGGDPDALSRIRVQSYVQRVGEVPSSTNVGAAQSRGEKRKASGAETDFVSNTSSGSSLRSRSQTQPQRVPPQATAMNISTGGGAAAPSLPNRPTAPGLSIAPGRHPLPPKPQFSPITPATATRAGSGMIPSPVIESSAGKRKRDTTLPTLSTPPDATADPKKRRM